MFKPSRICLSSFSKRTKRVQVQLLKDFPMFHLFKGQVTKVKPSFMRNFLHHGNGAKYILDDKKDIDPLLLASYQERQAEIELMNAKAAASASPAITMSTNSVSPLTRTDLETLKQLMLEKKEKDDEKHEKKEKGINPDITLENVKIPGLDL
ncbi:mitochondrial 54S ribosomal protein bL9m MRPL50 NDAI_0K01610 [Naumovozyma dairenensis CBS 421]|uniref:Ribosomal protein L9 domain-containing protein n=1 Tax=Naumovozyma dairenensis (strain ATCC 10597 / BCRC 20456 / CBS 421 / NBRC 0211 / NRRL Y-12639) TaxID=1071378 RepID=G0WHU1_NAUDC|nr:hypothetical protein NDAI_0K01610 [Naumovozyma dairenensis CBS 421]CCD27352.1 hypothetical protein NDAI_0K01610 [Naumovozyma dairenensis CBS 421]